MIAEPATANTRRFMWNASNRSLTWKLGGIVALMGAVLLVIAISAAFAIQYVLNASEQRAHAQEQTRLAYQLRGDIESYTNSLLDMAWTHSDRRTQLDLYTKRFAEHLAQAQEGLEDTEQQSLLRDLAQQQNEYVQLANMLVEDSQNGLDTEAAILWIKGKEMAERTYDLADRYYSYQNEQALIAQQAAQSRSRTAVLMLSISVVVALLLGTAMTTVLSRQIVRRLGSLKTAVQQVAAGERATVDVVSEDELGILAQTFNAMAVDLAAQREAQQRWSQELEQQVAVRTGELQEALQHQQRLVETIRDMSTPVIPVLQGVIVMPLVGMLDTERMLQAQETLLRGIEQQRAHTLILDITGIPIVDTDVAKHFITIARQARLLGTECVLVGISPEVAQTLVGLGIDLNGMRPLSDLRTAIKEALKERTPQRSVVRRAA
ncbi:MAG TPA: STAS domain-containing protein [Roseiflexaceae bacterium]|jgi:anti-anti-sigma regulatory factor/HAMP domain-containing protein|nr:STAS domain-containing protein [Roseiflexaceae bacterium]